MLKKSVMFTFTIALIATLRLSSITFGETTTFPVARDLWISSHGGEEHGNNGGAARLKLKGYQEFSLLDFDLEPLRGKRIKSARLRVTLAGDERLYRTAIGTISEDWIEGTGSNYEKLEGASTFARRVEPDGRWLLDSDFLDASSESSDLTSVTFGEGGSIWSHADASEPNEGKQTIEVAPEVVASRLYGFSYGFALFDDQGTEIVRGKNDKVDIRLFPNRFLYSREQNKATQPYLEVEYEDASSDELKKPVESPIDLKYENAGLPAGSVKISWTQKNCVAGEILGFEARFDGRPVPPALVPRPALGANRVDAAESQRFEMRLDRIAANAAKRTWRVEIIAVDSLGRKSESSSIEISPSRRVYENWDKIVGQDANQKPAPRTSDRSALPQFSGAEVAIVDEFIKFAEDGATIPKIDERVLRSSVIWNAASKKISLATARNEFIGFQIAFLGKSPSARLELRWEDGAPEKEAKLDWSRKSTPITTFYRYEKVKTPRGRVADPMIPCDFDASNKEQSDVYYCEIFTPQNAAPGVKKGALTIIGDGGARLALDVEMTVWNFALPNKLNFLPEMNCYGLPENELEYYRLANLHRVYVNRVPYSHRGTVGDGLAPRWDAKKREFEWNEWRARFERYFTGEAFKDLPRGAIPIEAFYLPLFENFPADVFTGLDENAWPNADAFSDEYRATFKRGVELFANEILDQKWSDTRFLFFLNNKSDYKRDGWSRASSPWLLDEPASYRDFAALRYFGRAVKDELRELETKRPGAARAILYRADISRPQWERDSLASLLDLYVVPGDVNKRYRRVIEGRREQDGRMVMTYGETAPPHESAYQPVLWQLDAWSSGADGIVPWQTIGNSDSWRDGDPLALFYPACETSGGKVAPSLRLKAYRRGEQDAEYLTLLQRASERPRAEIAAALRARLALDHSRAQRNSAEDAGSTKYDSATPDELEKTRREVGRFLDRVK